MTLVPGLRFFPDSSSSVPRRTGGSLFISLRVLLARGGDYVFIAKPKDPRPLEKWRLVLRQDS